MNDEDINSSIADIERQSPMQFHLRAIGDPVSYPAEGRVLAYRPGIGTGYYLLEMTKEGLRPDEESVTTPEAVPFDHETVFEFGDTGITKVSTIFASRYENYQEFSYPDIEIDPLANLRALLGPRNYAPY
ncbi:hypothetical protein FGG08_006481 [Glutinoglossum americanum]|uniref:Uncharacterized protein n=1 Tax=Glutinoglossum americanum TaxID=1670608 RepID=A0A9P8L0V9_9PEZI|nr:hypothetical protein FGG08_006481 [Glutinoglossum americanum]